MSNTRVTNGQSGGAYNAGTSLVQGNFGVLQVLTDAKFHTLTGNLAGVANVTSGSAPTIPAGTMLYGRFSAYQLHSGSVIAYDLR